MFHEPRIAGNTGNAIRMSAATGATLHLVAPLFDLSEAKVRRAGLDYHDLAHVVVHANLSDALDTPRITLQVRIPMLAGRRSLNLANAAAIAGYEAWRQLGFPGGI